MFFVKDSGNHSIVYVTDSEEDAIAVHDWYEENTISASMWAMKSKYNISQVHPDPSPLVEPMTFVVLAKNYGREWSYSVTPHFKVRSWDNPRIETRNHLTVVHHRTRTATAQEALDIVKEFCESLEES